HHGAGVRGDRRPRVEQRDRALDLGWPDEAHGAARRRELSLADQLAEGPSHLEDRGAPAGVVVGARLLVVQMTGEDDLLACDRGVWIAARDDCGDDVVAPGLLTRLDPCA